jgi:parallel beta-helix repeat protein
VNVLKISRTLKHLLLVTFFAGFFFIGTVKAQAATYYVAATGNDSNSGGVNQPFRTIARGVSFLKPGDILYIRSGIWDEQIDMTTKSGTAGNYITVAAYPGEKVTIATNAYPFSIKGTYSANNGYFIFDGLILDGINSANQSYWTIGNGSHHIIARNLEIKNWKGNGILVQVADNIQILNCKIHHQVSVSGLPGERWYGIYYHDATNGVIEGNEIFNNPGGGIQIYPGPITNLLVRGNYIHDNNSLPSTNMGGILVAIEAGKKASGLEISNNLVYKNGSAPTHGPSPGIRLSYGASNVNVWNNTVYANIGYGILIDQTDAVNNVVQNNIVYGNTSGELYDIGNGTVKDHNLSTNPYFVNPAAFDFNIQQTSPAINAGIALSQVSTDIRKVRRPQGSTHDIGAYEGSSTSLSPPKNLQIH